MSDQPTSLVLLHGTNRTFERFDLAKCRSALNDRYQGDGLCFTEDLEVAWRYAYAARNANIDRAEAFAGIERTLAAHPGFVMLFRLLVELGHERGWAKFEETMDIRGAIAEAASVGIDLNDLADVAEWVEGSMAARGADGAQEVMNIFHGAADSLPDWVVRDAAKFGIDCQPRVVVAEVFWTRLLDTNSRRAARTAFSKGYDAVRYTGPDIVSGKPEYMVRDPEQVRILDVLRPEPEPEDVCGPAPSFG